eukprot:TRINITY_DN2131_c0_g1_i4.p2 TRINITY_DN2131_c0_g1~~TRINITY_DN2131_c0_g1_i4.p2  ORF type:complete len:142 (-),score=40.71 TRINITY_DN2131_c0_g1_i4:680-1105(-)
MSHLEDSSSTQMPRLGDASSVGPSVHSEFGLRGSLAEVQSSFIAPLSHHGARSMVTDLTRNAPASSGIRLPQSQIFSEPARTNDDLVSCWLNLDDDSAYAGTSAFLGTSAFSLTDPIMDAFYEPTFDRGSFSSPWSFRFAQ